MMRVAQASRQGTIDGNEAYVDNAFSTNPQVIYNLSAKDDKANQIAISCRTQAPRTLTFQKVEELLKSTINFIVIE
jgi:hypothetical protein